MSTSSSLTNQAASNASTTSTTTSDSSSSSSLKLGDEVEFVISHNPRSGKYSATKIKRISSYNPSKEAAATAADAAGTSMASSSGSVDAESKRPERLITKLKMANIDDKSGKKLILIRQPNNPDGKAKSFSRSILERAPGILQNGELAKAAAANGQVATANSIIDGQTLQQAEANQRNTAVASTSSMSIMDLLMATAQQNDNC